VVGLNVKDILVVFTKIKGIVIFWQFSVFHQIAICLVIQLQAEKIGTEKDVLQ